MRAAGHAPASFRRPLRHGGDVDGRRIGSLFLVLLLVAVVQLAATLTGGAAAFTYDFAGPTPDHALRLERDARADQHVRVESVSARAQSHGYDEPAIPARPGGYRYAPNTAGRAAGLADDGVNVIPSSGRTFVGTPRGTVYDVPQGWAPRVADNGRGIVYQRPGALRNADSIRIMEPTSKYPSGYARYYNSGNQPLDVFGNPGAGSVTHIPQDYIGPWPGWPL